MSESHPTWTGRTIGGRYQIIELLGRGGMSSVYKAKDPNLQRTVAIKLIHPHLSENPEFVKRFEQEAAAVAQLRHPNIMLVHDFNHDGGAYYIVFEYIAGEPLDKRLRALKEAGLRLPLDEVVRIMIPLCEAVAYAHERKMIHRDLKPSNVIINLLGQPILLDFGIAKIVGGDMHTATGATIGTAAYMAPEQVAGEGVDHRADIYSLGIMLYEMSCGRPPYEGNSVITVMMKHVTEPLPDIRLYNANLPPAFVTVLERALAKEPQNRFGSAVEMARMLREVGRQLAAENEDESIYMTPSSRPAEIAPPLPPETLPEEAQPEEPVATAVPIPDAPHTQLDPEPEPVKEIAPSPPPTVLPKETAVATPSKSRLPWLLGGAAVLLLVLAGIFLVPRLLAQPPAPTGMVQIPVGDYTVGSTLSGSQYEAPQEVALHSFWIDRYEVTNEQYAEFLADSGDTPPSGWSGNTPPAGQAAHPVKGITWDAANDYCDFVDKRLPTEAEWEVAARGAQGFLYPWGNDATAVALPDNDTYAVGSVAANRSGFGAYDMAGNVWEWVDEPYTAVAGGQKVAHGGAYNFLKDSAYRLIGNPTQPTMIASVGVRCASSEVADAPNADVVLFDEFSDQASGWPDLQEGAAWRGYHPPDFYHVEATGANQVATAVFGSSAANVSLEARVFVDIVETDDGDFRYGLLLRQASDREFYAFTVSLRQGRWDVLKATADGLETLDSGTVDTLTGWSVEEEDALTVVANGGIFTFFINGRLVSSLTDNTYADGDFGFYVETFDETRAHVHFDRLTVLRVDGEPLALAAAADATAVPTAAVEAATAEATAVPTDEPTPTTEPTPTETAVAVPDGMVLIPAGTFLMGSATGQGNELPEHEVSLDAYFIDQFEVSNEAYRACVTAGGCVQTGFANSFRRSGYRDDPEYADYPVVGISWEMANAYCEWAGKRLPTEAEWEYAASGPDNFIWPWGNAFDPLLSAASAADTEAVDAFPDGVSPFDVYNMAGNVNEWVADMFDANFYANSPTANPVSLVGNGRVFRGGSFDNPNGDFYTTSRRYNRPASTADVDIGIRCAQDVP